MSKRITRRDFLRGTALGGAGLIILRDSRLAFGSTANDKLNIAAIGCGGKGHSDIGGCASQNIVALCDVDDRRAAGAYKDYPDVPKFRDFRRMLDKMHHQIDAVIVSTPDHTHAVAALMAMQMGKHVYCQKPLTHSINEARLMRDTARRYKVATQMGNQGTASNSMRESVEIIQSGALGDVHEVHVWSNRPVWPQGMSRPTEMPPVPAELDWDLWLGPAEKRPYHESYLPFVWRGWKPFGTGAVGDMGCHTLNMPFMALNLVDPISVHAEVFEATDDSYPKRSIIHFTFPKRGELPACTLTWYDGGLKPKDENILMGRELPGSGCVVIGTQGRLYAADDYGGSHILMPEEKFADYQLPAPTLPRSPGHYQEWIQACKGGEPAMSNFDYAAALTETALLGNLAVLTEEAIYPDAAKMRAINCPKAEQFIQPAVRRGWSL
jgi:predicted dehydrogenase